MQSFRLAGVDKILASYFVFYFLAALVLQSLESHINTYTDSLWYCFAVASTVGFGDITAISPFGRLLTVVLSLYTIIVVAIVTAVITSFFLDLARFRANESTKEFLDDLEHLTELSEEELEDLSERVKHFHVSGNKKHDRMNQNKRTNQD